MESASPQPNGLKTVIDTIVAPKEAFESIRTAPTWGWALSITLAIAAISGFLTTPALQHAMAAGWPATVASEPRLAQLTPEQQQMQLGFLLKISRYSWILVMLSIPFLVLLQTLLMAVFNAIGHGEGKFKHYWAAACNIAVPTIAIGAIVGLTILLVRGADSFESMQQIQSSMLSLAMVAPAHSGAKLTALLSTVTPFAFWAAGLAIFAMLVIGRVRPLQAWLMGAAWIVVPALFAFATAH